MTGEWLEDLTWPEAEDRLKAGRRVKLAEIRGDVTAVCMGLAEQVVAGQIVHPNDPMVNAHIASAQKMYRGDAWVFGRKDAGGQPSAEIEPPAQWVT